MQPGLADDNGYLIDPMTWDEAVAREFASQENIELTELHWDLVRFMRRYYEEHLIAPDARHTIKHLSGTVGKDARNKLFELFP